MREVIMRLTTKPFEEATYAEIVQELVRCKDCKHSEGHTELWCEVHEIRTDINYFCADGEREEK